MLLSRVAESVYWAGRYLERTEATARLVKVHTELYCDLPLSCGVGWSPLLAVTGSREAFDARHPTPTEDQVVAFLAADPDQSGSIVSAVAAARHNLKVTRNLLPPSTWEAINDLHHWVADTASDAIPRQSRLHWMDQVIRHCHLISGSMAATMCHDDAHAFLEVGRHLERADMTTRVLDVQAGILVQGTGPDLAPYSDITWMSVLRSLAADHMFRRSTLGVLSGPEALRFLLKDPTFPRSVERSLTEISRSLIELPGHDTAMATTAGVQASLEDVEFDSLAEGGLHEFVDDVQEGLATVHDELAAAYFQPVASGDAVSCDVVTIRVALEHHTTYRFDREVGIGPHIVRLRPAPHCRTPIVSYALRVEPGSHFLNWQQDPFGNYLARLVFPEPASELSFTVDLVADLTVINPFDFFMEEDSEHYPVHYGSATHDLAPYLVHDESGPLLDAYVAHFEPMTEGEPRMVDLLVEINQQICADVAYTTRMEPGVQTPDQTLEKALGSCRDSGWLMVAVLRRLGLAARFVSGYLVQLTADQKPLDGPAGPTADFTDLHAWCEVYVPGAGWIGLDPTSGLFAGEGHIPLCCTPHPSTAAPIEGSIDPTEVDLEFANVVRRIHEDPRVTLPYTEDQWSAIDALGHRVDARLAAGDVRLTLGGEPTFVSIDDMEGAEWTIDADGEEKRRLSWELTQRLARRFASGPLFHHGQGKWYPGEPLPRWQMGVHWRTDGIPLWEDPTLLGAPDVPGSANVADAQALSGAIARRLGIDLSFVQPAFEDPIAQVWDEARQPAGAPPSDLDPTDPLLVTEPGRKAALASLEGRAGRPVGFVLPLHPTTADRWMSTRWTFRRGRLLLVPGDSPMGLRLPLGAISWTAPPATFERSPFERREPLPPRVTTPPAAAVIGGPDDMPPTALCVEVRDGQLRVFLPPLERVEDFVTLLNAVESAAALGGAPVILEGYPPPRDPRLTQLVVTPDPGVIEVNVQPAGSWPEMVDLTTILFEEARECRLGTEKFDIDGAHWGTGGGNHLTLGGWTTADSPLLRRPDLLRSLLTYWQHHPSLSYLFSGRFVGPTSQAPRVDEGRDDALDELEVAFGELGRETSHGPARPWLVDRLFRHLLADVTGNTHRAEFCIDKLFSPDSERGRLGLLELRAFEMPPHPQMSLVQALLVRAIVARCWADPYEHRLVRWGTELHDRFLLPHEVAADVAEVIDDLAAHGLPFELDWLAPFLEFRFPRLGAVDVDGVHVELRAAVEPWLVLGEETAGGGTARYVDSSVERLQVLVEGAVEGRHVLTCNGIEVPLRAASGTADAKVAGVRYKAWQPPSSLHPTMPVHTPLVFDLIDTWNDASLGGCTYHVSHPGGLAYETFPVNANEADARRGSRFVPFGHTGADIDFDSLRVDGGVVGRRYPRTLDLRRHTPR